MALATDRAAKIRFRRAVTLMVMTLLLPGSAQLVAGNRRVGRIAMRTWFALLATGGLLLLVGSVWHGFAFWLLFETGMLGLLRLLLLVLAIGWAALFVDAWRIGEPLTLVRNQRLAVVGINGLLCFTVAGALLFTSHLVGTGRGALAAVFGDGAVAGAADGRYNVLLIGGDSGVGRFGLRPDSVTVASIDAETGRTVLIGLPRNLQDFEFAEGSVMAEQFPDGFDCEGCYLNSVSTWALDNKELFGRSRNPQVDAVVQAAEGITGLEVSYWAMVDLRGFRDLVDAVGGLTLNVRDRIPIGLPHDPFYDHIEPGVKELNGFQTLWFARARDGSDDYSRMARQKCVMNAFLQQVSPQDVLTNFRDLADAGTAMLRTSLPRKEVGKFLELALAAKSQKMSTVSLVPPMINTADPDLDLIREKVELAIDRAEGDAEPAPKPKKRPTTTTGGSLGTRDSGYAANQTADLSAAC